MDKISKRYDLPEEFPPMIVEENNGYSNWGGSWTEQKLDTFESYVKAYLTIMNAHRDKYNWKLIYFDGFAGSGTRSEEEKQDEVYRVTELFGEDQIEKQELALYQGAAERVVRLENQMNGFDFYYFIDKFPENCEKLKQKLSKYQTKGIQQYRAGDANDIALQLADSQKKNSKLKCLCLLDPFGMSINWKTIEALAGPGIDLWILLPSGVIVNRLLKKNGELLHPRKLENFFGMSKEEIHEWFYKKDEQPSLFEDFADSFVKKNHAIELIAKLYCKRLGKLFRYVTEKPLLMTNNHNVPIFHFVCASNNQTAVNIAQQIIDKRQ